MVTFSTPVPVFKLLPDWEIKDSVKPPIPSNIAKLPAVPLIAEMPVVMYWFVMASVTLVTLVRFVTLLTVAAEALPPCK